MFESPTELFAKLTRNFSETKHPKYHFKRGDLLQLIRWINDKCFYGYHNQLGRIISVPADHVEFLKEDKAKLLTGHVGRCIKLRAGSYARNFLYYHLASTFIWVLSFLLGGFVLKDFWKRAWLLDTPSWLTLFFTSLSLIAHHSVLPTTLAYSDPKVLLRTKKANGTRVIYSGNKSMGSAFQQNRKQKHICLQHWSQKVMVAMAPSAPFL
ncbi:uncharacterized protein DEA37_0014544 [Paragonimus westermani]|uniref:Uncharacterized protein n=1 Tax=Paragonimus westermani TaxID=34504 RepID=A0A5J4NEG1_9TREM|nr:uncharacterized protein DEA37_0014544 [Paragonimus westermani]